MTDHGVTESVVEQAALAWLEAGGWSAPQGGNIALNTSSAVRVIGRAS